MVSKARFLVSDSPVLVSDSPVLVSASRLGLYIYNYIYTRDIRGTSIEHFGDQINDVS